MNKYSHDTSYKTYEKWKTWDQSEFGQFNRKEYYYFKKILSDDLTLAKKGNLSILEIGFGNGSLAGWLRNSFPGVQWTGVEIQESLINKARKANFQAVSAIPDKNRKFDLVIAIDVLEHLTDQEISNLFDQIKLILNPNGKVIARTPNAAGPFGLPNQTGDPTHTTPISASRLNAYLNDWTIQEKGDCRPLWEGKFFSYLKNSLRAAIRLVIDLILRFAFAPQPKTFCASNIHLFFLLRK